MAEQYPYHKYDAQTKPEVGDVVCMASDLREPAVAAFHTSIVSSVTETDVHLARAHLRVSGPGRSSVLVGVEHYSVGRERFTETFVAFSSGTKIDNRNYRV